MLELVVPVTLLVLALIAAAVFQIYTQAAPPWVFAVFAAICGWLLFLVGFWSDATRDLVLSIGREMGTWTSTIAAGVAGFAVTALLWHAALLRGSDVSRLHLRRSSAAPVPETSQDKSGDTAPPARGGSVEQFIAAAIDEFSRKQYQSVPVRTSLGGNLGKLVSVAESPEQGDSDWEPVADSLDAAVDWTSLRGQELQAVIIAKGTGSVQFGLRDDSTHQIIVEADPSTVLNQTERPFRMLVPPADGVKHYRLVFRKSGTGPLTVAAQGSLLAAPIVPKQQQIVRFRIGSSVPVTFDAEHPWRPVPGAERLEVDWTATGAVAAVIAVGVQVRSPGGEPNPKARVRLRDVESGSVEASAEGTDVLKLTLPRRTSVRRYVLEVEVAKPGVAVGASGEMALFK